MAGARVCLVAPGTGGERLDGAWWPRSRDLCRELPAVIAALDQQFGRISRITVDSSRWPEPPRRVAVAGRTIDVGWFPVGRNRIEICVLSNDAGRWDLIVVPPEYQFAESASLMTAAAGNLDRHVAEVWLSGMGAEAAATEQRASASVGESEAGRGLAPDPSAPDERYPTATP